MHSCLGAWRRSLPPPDGRSPAAYVVELDYSAQHPTLLYALKGLPLPDAPYDIAGCDRAVVKQAVLIALNASSRTGALSALHRWAREEREKTGFEDGYQVPKGIMDAIEHAHAPIREHLYSGAWKFLQRHDSNIAERVMNHFTTKGVATLMVHDSFIVEQQYEAELKQVMIEAMRLEVPNYPGTLNPRIKRG